MNLPGTRIFPSPAQPDQKTLDAFASVVTPHLSDNMGRHVGLRGLTRFNKRGKLVGTALTVKCRPGDNLYVYKAMTMLQPGQVLVIAGGGATDNALIGELIKLQAEAWGCVGFIVDGAIRDVASFEDTPLYARAITHCGPYKNGPGEINVPVCIGGQVINPGDIIVGDEDGVVSFSPDHAETLLAKAHAHAEKERKVMDEIATGTRDPQWLNAVLDANGLGGK
ncbi:RraA family protein [Halomonas sp. HAL1]|uniref:RraA family protein n=1 Tax=Halomonas sp. HAL1 TaxID=550984 RepID=UPI00022D299A|nr:RraA family protein [Halomonas sp. HAL1]EHA14898.1 putative aldolase [Halomonas sp. HAL1]WKV94174.1 RraA family protein [Halomonas sp. HAL1]